MQAQDGAPRQADARSETQRYEVVSVRPHKQDSDAGGRGFSPEGFDFSGITLKGMITTAYDIGDNQVYGLPEWVQSNYYDFQAKVDADTAEAWKKSQRKQIAALQECPAFAKT